MRIACKALIIHVLLISTGAQAATVFGIVELAEGEAHVIDAGGRITTPLIGDKVTEGSTLITGPDGELHIETADDGLVALRPNTRLRVDEYRANGDGTDRQLLSLVKGTFRSISGWIGRNNPGRYEIRTPTATMGIRGTDHEPAYWPVAIPGEVSSDEVGTYDRVNEGRTFIRNEQGTIELGPTETGFVGKGRFKPRKLKAKPGFYRGGRHEQRIQKRREQLREKIRQRGLKPQGAGPRPEQPGRQQKPDRPASKNVDNGGRGKKRKP